jgi:hypothetical protein
MVDSFDSERTSAAALDPGSGAEPSDQFLNSLTSAMRRVADDARETSLADARGAVAAKIAAMRSTAGARAEELRTRAEQDVTGIGDWSRAEIVRIEAETQRKIEQRRAQLAEQLEEHDRRSAEEIAGLEAQVEQYEGELALFFSQLGEINDPDTFIAAARRMPRLPQVNDQAPAPELADEPTAAAHEERLRNLGIERNGDTDMAEPEAPATNGVSAETEPAMEEMEPPAPPASLTAARFDEPESAAEMAAVTGDDTVTTTVAAVGLGSFGAVTSFKSALEKADGVAGVRLSLGSGGEFVYTVMHAPSLDLGAVATAAQPGSSVQRDDDGVLHLSAGKRR